MASLRPTKLKPKDNHEVRKLTAVALSLVLAMTALTTWLGTGAQAADGSGLNASYYDSKDFTNLKLSRTEDQVDHDWDYGTPDASLGQNNFSARWMGSVEPRYSDTYSFYTFSDDGIRLWVNGKLLIDNWTDHPRMEDAGKIRLEAGKKYPIKLEYYENTGRAILRLSWSSDQQPKEIIPKSQLFPGASEPTPTPSTSNAQTYTASQSASSGLRGEYYNNIDLSSLALARNDLSINFDWKQGSPDSSIGSDTYSVRWTGSVTPPSTQTYTFSTLTDDGVRLWVNNQLIIDNWTDHPLTSDQGTASLQAGQSYPLKMEYFERTGGSAALLYWSSPELGRDILKSQYLTPSGDASTVSAPAAVPAITEAVQMQTKTVTSATLSGEFYTNPYSLAQNWVNANKNSNPYGASLIEKISQQPTATWLGGWNSNIYEDVRKTSDAASAAGKTALFVAYNIPQRDCGGYSSGGIGSMDAYRSWIGSIASAIGSKKALVILEPDALSSMDCLSSSDRDSRMSAIRDAVSILKGNSNTAVYIDAGHAGWIGTDEMAGRLAKAGIDRANGFSLNTSNFITTSDNANYGQQISSKTNGKHFVIDTSRNGNGPTGDNQWCNPWGRALGQKPTTSTGNPLIDAYLWIKAPGESDGNCNGGPNAGDFWPDYAMDLVKNSGY